MKGTWLWAENLFVILVDIDDMTQQWKYFAVYIFEWNPWNARQATSDTDIISHSNETSARNEITTLKKGDPRNERLILGGLLPVLLSFLFEEFWVLSWFVIHSTSSREATSTTPNKQLASIRTFQERRGNKSINNLVSSCEEAKVFKYDHHPQPRNWQLEPSSSARVPGSRASYILYRRIARADYQISPQQAPTLGSRVVLNITTTPHFSGSSQASTVTIQRPGPSPNTQNGQPIFQTDLVLGFRPEPESKATTCLHENEFGQQYAQHGERGFFYEHTERIV
jgi:hypothetical protein